ncbi:oxysterol-binding protein-related protein 5 isoform X10 [Balaenoptera musculus]|uniref:Oxysterol-binding protein n=1 Tax=Balaenoptera musculus TaxID=9771 RepID=A0A8B8Y6B5_BALMU|nr:oxysterol-binding protein-related protein 5 isoform X10 [Balaenoptera musculus]
MSSTLWVQGRTWSPTAHRRPGMKGPRPQALPRRCHRCSPSSQLLVPRGCWDEIKPSGALDSGIQAVQWVRQGMCVPDSQGHQEGSSQARRWRPSRVEGPPGRASPGPSPLTHPRVPWAQAQKESYRQEKKRATKQLLSALTDPSVVIMADSLKPSRCPWVPGRHGRQRPSPQIRGTLKSWTKLWCVLKPGVLLIYKTPKVGQWVGTVLLHCCELIERPSKKDGFCFKLFHPLDQSVWAVKGPKGESVGSITQPLPSSYLIFRAASESDGRCWLDALELALRCSSLLRLSACKQGRDGEPGSSPDASPSSLCGLPPSAAIHDQDLFPLNGSSLENDAFSDKSERENAEDSDKETQDHRRKAESGSDQSEAPGRPVRRGTTYVVQDHEELGELGEASQVETVSDEHKSLMWVLLKQLRPGMDLSRVVLPTFVLEPRSFLNKLSDYYYHADLLSRAALEEDAYSRIKLVLQWYLSGFYKKPKGIKKPYNPILGETFRCCWFHPQSHSHTFYIAEQVSHHPPVSAFHVSNRKDGFCISGSITAKSRFYGNSLSALLDGKATLTFLNRVEDYTLTMPYAHCKGILYGTMTMELGGRVTVECEKNNFQAELEFKLKPFFGGSTSLNQVSGKITSGEEVLARLTGHWDREVFIKEEGRGGAELFWNPSEEIRGQRLKRHTVPLEEQTELESERLWQHVTRAISEGDQHKATQEKFALEEAQRQRARERQQNLVPWSPQLFQLDPASREWRYRYEEGLAPTGGSARPATSRLATARPPRAAAPRPSPARSSLTRRRTVTSLPAARARALGVGRRRGGCSCCTRGSCPSGRPSRSYRGISRPC